MGMMNCKELKGMNYKPGMRLKPVHVGGISLTKQEFAQESDINQIMKRFPGFNLGSPVEVQGVFADATGYGSFGDTLRRVDEAREAFMLLSPSVRGRFDNDPVQLIEFLQDEKNRDEAIKLGLVPKKEEPVIPTVRVLADPLVPPVTAGKPV